MDVREARPDELPAVLNVLDGAALETDYDRVRDRMAVGDVLVAVPDDDPERVLGACVLDGERIDAIAVRRQRRGQGIGTELVRRARRDRARLIAAFDAGAVPFYESLGFDVRRIAEDRYAGLLSTADLPEE